MFYSDVILSKKGKLSKVWLAAHAERRMTKAMILDTNIVKSVSSIINKRDEQDAVPMALRLSGQLLFGVVRIYSRQAKYLLDDCNEAIIKLKTAFRAGVVDMTMQASRSAITLSTRPTVLDPSLPDPAFEGWDVDSVAGGSSRQQTPRSIRSGSYTARPEDITLQRYLGQAQEDGFGGWNAGGLFDPDAGVDLQLGGANDRGLERRDSQGREIDADGDPIDADSSSIGVGRDAASQAGRQSLNLGDFTDDFGGPDFGAGLDGGLDLGLEQFDAERQRSSTPMRQIGNSLSLMQDLTPRTALKVQQAAEKRAAIGEKTRKQLVDARTELQEISGRPSQPNQSVLISILAQERYLPKSRVYMQLLEMQANPARHILPFTAIGGTGNLATLTSSKGLAPQLSELFTFETNNLRRHRSPSVDLQGEDRGEKRQRLEEDDSFEIGRRAASTSVGGDMTGLEMTFDDFGGDDGAPFDLPALGEADISAAADLGIRRSLRKRVTEQQQEEVNAFDQRGDLPRLATPSVIGEGETQASSVFDSPISSNLLRAFEGKLTNSDASYLEVETQMTGMSKNTARAIKVLRKELHNNESEDDDEAGEVTFSKITANTTRRAAAGFFFEILQLGTKDSIKVEQQDSFGEIVIKARPGLWQDEIVAPQSIVV